MTVEAPALPILYSFRRCPYAMRARLALQISQTRCELREVILRDKPPAMLEASPKGTVPVLIDTNGVVIDESLDVMLWALNKNDPQQWLTPKHGAVDEMLVVIHDFDEIFKPQLDRYKYPNRFDDANPITARDDAAKYLCEATRALASSAYLFGHQPCLADMALAPFVRQYANTDRGWFDAQDWPQIQQWLNGILDSELFAAIMPKYPQWKAPDAGVVFPEKISVPQSA
ncbi:MAG: glutathione S-transferase [Gammaproteobacteria bacterium]